MQSVNLDVEVAMLRVAHLTSEDLIEVALWPLADKEGSKYYSWSKANSAIRKSLNGKPRTEQLRIAAAALLLASDELDKTPFDRWLESAFTEASLRNFSEGVINSMRAAYEAGGNG